MFNSARWRSEKNKIKVVFKLQFYATQVLQPGIDALALSLIPVDVGKPSTTLESAKVRDGNCRWENPVFEFIKFIQNTRTGKIYDKIYHFVVSTGSSKTGFFGEVSINFADYAEATKPSSVSLPLKSSYYSAVLHVSIQRLQENAVKREEEYCEEVKGISHDRSLKMYLSSSNTDESNQTDSAENAPKAIRQKVGLSVDSRSSSGSEMTRSSSESSYGIDTPHEISLRNSSISLGPNRFLSSLNQYSEAHNSVSNTSIPLHEDRQRSRSESFTGSDHGLSLDDSTNSSHDNLMRKRSVQASDAETEKLKADMAILARQLDFSELELQTLRKQIVKENKRGHDLLKEVAFLKEERDSYKSECERLRSFQKRMEEAKARNKSRLENGDLQSLLEETKEELSYEKELNANLKVQLQKTQESNAELMLAVHDLDEMLEQKNKEISNLSNQRQCEDGAPVLRKSETDDDEEQKALEKLVKQHSNVREKYVLEQKIEDLYGEIEIYRREKDELEMQMEQLALDYEILKQENHDISYKLEQSELQEQLKMQYECSSPPTAANDPEDHIKNLENELKRKSKEVSDSIVTIKELETHIKTLEDEMEKQGQGFETDLKCLTHLKVEQEQRAIRAEAALRQTRLRNASTAEKLQEEFRRLSMQMASTFNANEKLAMKAMTEANELHAEKNQLQEMLLEAKKELHLVNSDYEEKLHERSCQIDMQTQQIEDMLLEVEDRAKQLESQQKHEKEVIKTFSEEIRMLKAENLRLETEINCLFAKAEQKKDLKAEVESMKYSVEEVRTLIQRANAQRNELVSAIALFKKETEKSVDELNIVMHIKNEKERTILFISSELENLKAQCSDLRNSLFENEVEKEKLRKQVLELKGDLKKKEKAFSSIEKKCKDKNGHIAVSDRTKTGPKNKKSFPNCQSPKQVSSSLREKVKMLEDLIKMKENALETSTMSFLEKEKELQHKIEELEDTMEKLNENSPPQKVFYDNGTLTLNDNIAEPTEDTMSLDMRTNGILRETKGSTAKANYGIHNHYGDTATELASLEERNKSMENELKEMQERYSEISLKFAEVEGERQKLVMTVRNLKNAKKN